MRVIEGQLVDLIDPFPMKEIYRVYGWLHCYRTMTESDVSPKTPEEYMAYLGNTLPSMVSYGVIDKVNATESRHEAPLIGIITFEPHTVYNGFVHVASTRKAWGKGLIDEAACLVKKDLFDNLPSILRLSAWIFKNNIPAQHFVIRAGFRKEGVLRDFILQNGVPKTIYQYGLTRRDYATSSNSRGDSGDRSVGEGTRRERESGGTDNQPDPTTADGHNPESNPELLEPNQDS